MKNMFFAAFAVLGIVLGAAALMTPANASLPQSTYTNQSSAAGGEG